MLFILSSSKDQRRSHVHFVLLAKNPALTVNNLTMFVSGL